ncbi:histidine kinase [Kribbella sp. NPDC056951]|uniref:sensor histidine kinase n=1 Tax=Kribbella sp. NPDC056951 TaxID=3345978 RepID=UPI00362B8903
MSRARWSATAATCVCLAAVAALALGRSAELTPVFVLDAVPLGLGWLLVVRAPGYVVGPVLTWLAASLAVVPAVEAWSGPGVWPWQLVGFLALLLVFPDGLLPGRRWRAVAFAVPGAALLVNVAFVLTMNYHDDPPMHSPISVPRAIWYPMMFGALFVLLVVSVLCVAAVVVRYRTGDDRVREQLKWLILAAVLVLTLMVASWVVAAFGWLGPEVYGGFLLGIVILVPAAVTIAVLRYDLFEIGRLLSDSLAWVLTTAVAAVALAGIAGSLDYLIDDDRVGLTGSVFLVALGVLPLHGVIHRAVARVIDRDRAVVLDRIQRFVEQVRDGSAEPENVQDVLRTAVGDPQLVLLLTDLDGSGYVDLTGAPAEPPTGELVTLRSSDTDLGVLVLTPGSARRVRQGKLAASAARLPIEVSRLRLGLRRAVHEIDESRLRLVTAAAQERRRLERDLHDGAQQQLVALGMQLRLAQRRLPDGHPVGAELDQAVERIENTVAELRRLAHGVRPASLHDGLGAALTRLGADAPLPVRFEIALDGDDPDELVASTAYFVVAEAMANVLKHADATAIEVSARQAEGKLEIRVSDDGRGGASGLTTLRDRVGSIGGQFTVTSERGTGTTIVAVLPCGS